MGTDGRTNERTDIRNTIYPRKFAGGKVNIAKVINTDYITLGSKQQIDIHVYMFILVHVLPPAHKLFEMKFKEYKEYTS